MIANLGLREGPINNRQEIEREREGGRGGRRIGREEGLGWDGGVMANSFVKVCHHMVLASLGLCIYLIVGTYPSPFPSLGEINFTAVGKKKMGATLNYRSKW